MAKKKSTMGELPVMRIEIPFFEGVNTIVGSNIAKKNEFEHVDNARSVHIGTIEKRAGTRRLGDALSVTANYGLFCYENDGATNTGFYRICTSGGTTEPYYISTSATWTKVTDTDCTRLYELGTGTTQFDITNTAGSTYRYAWDGMGTDPNIDSRIRVGSELVINAQNFNANNNGTFTVTAVGANYFEVTNASGVAENNVTVGTGSVTVTGNDFDHVTAEDCLFLVNGHHDNIYIEQDTGGVGFKSSTESDGHLYGSPKAHKITHYKDRLYLADYITDDGIRYRNGIMMSSVPLGIVGLIDGDYDVGSTELSVTDTKYIQNSDTLEVFRGAVAVETLNITGKTESAITVAATVNTLNSADEIWVSNTNTTSPRKFRWSQPNAGGVAVREYDTFKLSGESNDSIKLLEPINDILMVGNSNNLATWDNYTFRTMDLGIGCVSENGYVKALGTLFFLHYTGIYATNGDRPRLISAKVQDYIDGATKTGLENAASGRQGLSIYFSIGDVTLYHPDGSVKEELSDVVLEYNLRQENWFAHTGIDAKIFRTYLKTDDADRLQFASKSGNSYHIFEFLNGDTDDRVSSDNEITMRADTSNMTLCKAFEHWAYPLDVIIEAERGSSMQCFVSLDNGPWYELKGEAVKGCTVLKVHDKNCENEGPPRCRRIRLSLRDSSRKRCRLSRLALRYAESSEELVKSHENYG